MKKNNLLPHIQLIGDQNENFYQLGLKDRGNFLPVVNAIKSLISTNLKPLDLIVEEAAKAYLKHQLLKEDDFTNNCKSYSEGLDRPYEEIALCMLLPELMCNLSNWIPAVPNALIGCSSYFYIDDESNTPGHVRVLDFPLHEVYQSGERAISYNFDGASKIFSFSTSGFFYPSITAMSEKGFSIALHQKFTDVMDKEATPIFEIINKLLSQCSDTESIISFLNDSRSMTCWGINIGLKNGDVIEADISSKNFNYILHKLEKGKIIYIDNSTVDTQIKQQDFLPYGLNDFNQFRKKNAAKKVSKILKSKDKITDESILKLAATPLTTKLSKNWDIDTFTPSSLMICAMNPSQEKALYIPGNAPKLFQKEILKFTHLWSKPEQELVTYKKSNINKIYHEGIQNLMKAQLCFDQNDIQSSYHNIQLAMEKLKHFREGITAEFYFLVLQFQFEKHREIRHQIYMDFKGIKDKLPPYLKDHCYLFIMRLEIILSSKTSVHSEDIENLKLKEIYEFEMNIPPMILHKTVSLLMNIRIDMQDIIYPHAVKK